MGIEEFRRENSDGRGTTYERKKPDRDVNYEEVEKIDVNEEKMKGFFLGLIVGEGSFSILLQFEDERRLGVAVRGKFDLRLHEENQYLLKYLHESTELGYISYVSPFVNYRITSLDECLELERWIENNLEKSIFKQTAKYESFVKWGECLSMIEERKHLTKDGLLEIAKLRDNMNRDQRGRNYEEIKERVKKFTD